ncbi:XdhC family protein [Salinigranum marinum]|uniref:XdhC family protein n=1 Tax=Salinigranum marinum TaxID=1515595 RepID=UPI002989FD54|nr:XdhC family protein [Salinigranum marinum]
MTDDTETETNRDEHSARADAASRETVDRLARQYTEQGQPFARVTVVRREPPVSARVGDRAIVTPDGELTGWIGGVACAQSVAVREAQTALRRGDAKLVGIAPDPDTIDRSGLEAFPMTCHSQGTLELFVEPVTPVPRLVVVGDSPIARAVSGLAAGLPYDLTVVAPDGADVAGADRLVDPGDAASLAEAFDGATWVVVASMGATDDVAVEAALAAGVPYVGLVASRRRADELCERVADRTGRAVEDVRAAVTSPAGVDIGARIPEEISVSVLAELISVRRAGDAAGSGGTHEHADATGGTVETHEGPDADGDADVGDDTGGADPDHETATDPVCGMDVTVGEAAATATHEGRTYHFCGQGCQEAFVDDPDRFVERAEP